MNSILYKKSKCKKSSNRIKYAQSVFNYIIYLINLMLVLIISVNYALKE